MIFFRFMNVLENNDGEGYEHGYGGGNDACVSCRSCDISFAGSGWLHSTCSLFEKLNWVSSESACNWGGGPTVARVSVANPEIFPVNTSGVVEEVVTCAVILSAMGLRELALRVGLAEGVAAVVLS